MRMFTKYDIFIKKQQYLLNTGIFTKYGNIYQKDMFQGLENPHCIAVSNDDVVYVGEAGPNRILKIE